MRPGWTRNLQGTSMPSAATFILRLRPQDGTMSPYLCVTEQSRENLGKGAAQGCASSPGSCPTQLGSA